MTHQRISRLSLFIITLFSFYTAMAQKKFNYDTAWKKVEAFQGKGLPKSALEEVKNIYAKAKADKQEAQQVKALIFQSQLVMQVEENEWIKNVNALEAETLTAAEPVRQILNSVTADLYYNYFQNKRYQIYQRTNTANFKKDDPETWTITDFHKKIAALYESSLANAKLLQSTKLDKYDPIIIKGNMRNLRPTLFDLLAWKALDYFKTDEADITKPAYAFVLNDAASLAAAPIFIRYKYESKDSSSLQLKAVKLYQQILAFHTNNANKAAFIDADISRIMFTHSKSVNSYKEQLYKETLEQIFYTYKGNPEAMQAGYLLAQWWNNKGNAYKPGTGTAEDKNAIKVAVEIAENVVKLFPKSEGGINAGNMLAGIKKPTLNMQVEKVNTPDMPFRALVDYKGYEQLNLRLIKVTEDLQKQLDEAIYSSNEAYWSKLVSLSAQKTWKQSLPKQDDYRQHNNEIKVDALPIGKYAILSSVDNQFSMGKNPLAVVFVHVSNISFVHNGSDYYVLNRETGQPLANAKIQTWYRQYDYNTRKYQRSNGELKTTDKNGFVKLTEDKQGRNISLDITWNNDRLALDDEMYLSQSTSYNSRDEIGDPSQKNPALFELNNLRYYYFSDRSIYRPGQTIYFKAIGITKDFDSKKSKLYIPKDSVEVELKNANYQKVESIKLMTNEYGSVFGKFKLPENTLNGNFSLSIKNNSTYNFSVEEYKRPKFLVEYEKVKGSYRVNDSVKVTGTAKGYAGNNIDGAIVKYRVQRSTRYMYPWIFWRKGIWPPQDNGDMEITNGETTTNAEGKFNIVFEAIPDLSVSKEFDPTFDYTIEADVTDINGETRSGETSVTVAYKALQLSISVPGGTTLPVDSLKNITIRTQNMSGEFEPAKAEVKIYPLQDVDRLLRKRYWAVPDTFVMSQTEFAKAFPYDPYKTEDDYRTWNKGNAIANLSITTAPNTLSPIPNPKLLPGWYIIEATAKDKYGEEVKAVEYVQLYDVKTNKLPSKQYDWDYTIKGSGEPGEKASFVTGTSADNLWVVQETVKPQDAGRKTLDAKGNSTVEFLTLNKQISSIDFPITEADRGGYAVNRFFVKHNRFYSNQWQVTVPWTNKQLDISFETFRDKLLPGQEEKWKVKIKGYKGEKIAAEMLASMYDASLDQFKPHDWVRPNIWPNYYFYNRWEGGTDFANISSTERYWGNERNDYYEKTYDQLMSVGGYNNGFDRMLRGKVRGMQIEGNMSAPMAMKSMGAPGANDEEAPVHTKFPKQLLEEEKVLSAEINVDKNKTEEDLSTVQVRTNLQETAFFFPDLHTDAEGNIEFSFTIPEALTKWKIQTLAHTKDLAIGMASNTTITQKDLMVQPNAPRFFREGDKLELSTKVVNLTDKPLTGQAQLQLFDAATNKPVDGLFKNSISLQNFTAAAGQSVAVKFPIEIPFNFGSALTYRIVAKAGAVSDGEENAAPVLTNRMLVTESLPMNIRNTNSKDFKFEKLLKSGGSNTLTNQGITIEFTSNPVWYAVQSLPYLMEYPYECAEQNYNRFYANALATKIANSMPKIKAVFEKWKTSDTAALLSNLEKNQELKLALLEETPWVIDAQNESKQKKNIGLLFDMVKMSQEAAKAIAKVKEMQTSNGGFMWFKGGPDDRYMTQYIISSMGHLRKLGVLSPAGGNTEGGGGLSQNLNQEIKTIISKAIPYLDARIKEDYDWLIKYKADLTKNNLSSMSIQYLYMRSFFTEYPVPAASKTAYEYYLKQETQYWLQNSKYDQGMIALTIHRQKDLSPSPLGKAGMGLPVAILKSLRENSITKEEFGMYWKEFNTCGYYWYQAPIESHALLIEAFSEIENKTETINDLKTWLLKQKQTQNWKSTKATAEACYALLLQGSNWINVEKTVTIKLGDYTISSNDNNIKAEAGTGYIKTKIDGKDVKPNMGNISVKLVDQSTNKQANQSTTSWGAVYWQYFENLDKITMAATPLSLVKKLFVEKNTDRGPVLTPVNDGDIIKIGDKIKVRIELRVDRNMEYVHMKDMRAACMEPVNVLSQYKYQDGLGYYESTKDASTNFFFSYLNKGTYVFEYPLTVTHSGNFSNGVTSIQCMYAPEFTSHSEGVRVTVK
jgi:Bacterial Alpha-2-macroglobulin MG10 domain/Alpha-2-macroglobulin family/MG2 domain